MSNTKKIAAISGASGLVGQELVKLLLDDPDYKEVISFSRKPLGIKSSKLTEFVGDLLVDGFFEPLLHADDVYCCVGTTRKKTPDLGEYRSIDYGIPVRMAQMGMKGSCLQRFIVISAMGANAEAKMFYPRIKGQMEMALKELNIPHLYILRPSVIDGSRKEIRTGEQLSIKVMNFFKALIPDKYKTIKAEKIALAMWRLSKHDIENTIVESDEVRHLAEAGA